MEYRQLGNSGMRVSELCLGTMTFDSRRVDEKTSATIINEALDSGINFIDEADVYAGGVSEEIVGKVLSQNGRRNEIVLATKGVAPMGEGANDWGGSRYHIIRAVEDSLRRLQTDRIDLYYLHIVDLTTPMEEIMAALETLVYQGKILYVGTSKWPPTLLMEALSVSKNYSGVQIIAEQSPYNILDRGVENELAWACMRNGVGMVTFSPLAGGILSGKYRKGSEQPKGSRYEKAASGDSCFTPEALDAVEKLISISESKSVSLSELSHAWLLQRSGIASVVIGPRTTEHLQSAIKSCKLKLTNEELEKIDSIVPSGRAVSDYYNRNVYARMRKAVNAGDVMAF